MHVLEDDPLAGPPLAALRDLRTPAEQFRREARRLGAVLTLRATEGMAVERGTVETPLGTAATVGPASPVVAVPVLRAGLGLLPGVHDLLPDAPVGMVGLERDHATLQPRHYYLNLPDVTGAHVLVLEPMLATGGSAAAAVDELRRRGAGRIVVLSATVTREGLDRLGELGVPGGLGVVTAAVDDHLDDAGYIVPGLGDFGDRLFGMGA